LPRAGPAARLVRLYAPLRPGKIVVRLNYVEHVEESSRTLDTAKDCPPPGAVQQAGHRGSRPREPIRTTPT